MCWMKCDDFVDRWKVGRRFVSGERVDAGQRVNERMSARPVVGGGRDCTNSHLIAAEGRPSFAAFSCTSVGSQSDQTLTSWWVGRRRPQGSTATAVIPSFCGLRRHGAARAANRTVEKHRKHPQPVIFLWQIRAGAMEWKKKIIIIIINPYYILLYYYFFFLFYFSPHWIANGVKSKIMVKKDRKNYHHKTYITPYSLFCYFYLLDPRSLMCDLPGNMDLSNGDPVLSKIGGSGSLFLPIRNCSHNLSKLWVSFCCSFFFCVEGQFKISFSMSIFESCNKTYWK